ncbi:MAG: hypothetical protein DRP64_14100, partial [Verrucomicrobia bacterium]
GSRKLRPPPKAQVFPATSRGLYRAWRNYGGHRTKAAEKLGMSRRTLHFKLNEYGVENLKIRLRG